MLVRAGKRVGASLPLKEARLSHAVFSRPSRGFSSTSPARDLLRTPLYDFHTSRKAKMVGFAGFSMPLNYGDVSQSIAHNHVRTSVGLFDVSHMLQHRFTGPSAEAFLMSLCPTSLNSLPPWSSSLSVLLNETGGIIDDMMVTKQSGPDEYYVVTNAGRIKEDSEWIQAKLDAWNAEHSSDPVNWERMDGWGLLALQGPKAAETLQKLTDTDLSQVKFGKSTYAEIGKDKVKCHVARGGYTGEDGFEISIPPAHVLSLGELLSSQDGVMMIGLGARDSLRLEAGMCLYGNDLNETITPVEAGLTWTIGKDRRSDSAAPFPGRSEILAQIASGPQRRRVGIEIVGGAPAREGCQIFDVEGKTPIGIVTSGIPSPTLGTNIAMGYVVSGNHKKGTEVMVEVRKKMRPATIKGMPFVPAKYYK